MSAAVLGAEPHAAAHEVSCALAVISNRQWDTTSAHGGVVLRLKWHSLDSSVCLNSLLQMFLCQ